MISIALLSLMNIAEADQTFTNRPCEPVPLLVIQKSSPTLYEVRMNGTWPAVLQTKTYEITGSGERALWVRLTGIKNLPTQDGFSQSYRILEECKPDGTWEK